MVYRFLKTILKYRMLHLIVLALCLFATNKYIFFVLSERPRIIPFLTNSAVFNLTKILLLMFWLICTYFVLMTSIYKAKTGGRNLWKDKRKTKRTFIELLDYFKDADLYRIRDDDLPVLDWKAANGVILGKKGKRLIYHPSASNNGEGKNFALFALPGGGKTTSQIIPSALRFGGSILAIDIKGDILSATNGKRNIKIFSPASPDRSCNFDPLGGIDMLTISERKTFVEQISQILVHDEKEGKYFTEGARDFFCGVALYLLQEDIRTSLPTISKAILNSNPFAWAKKIASSECEEAKEYTNSYIGSNEKNVAGAYNAIAKAVRPFASGELAKLLKNEADCLSPKTLEEGFDIYIEIPQDKIKVYAPISTIMVQNFMTFFMKRSDTSSGEKLRPILFLLDEFPQLGFDFATLSSGLSTLRSKCVSIFLAQQSIAQLIRRYGDEGCREIIDTCSYISIMSAQDPKSRQFFQDLIGTKKTLKMTSSEGISQDASSREASTRSAQEACEPIFHAEDFSNLGDNVVIYANGKYILAEKTYFYK